MNPFREKLNRKSYALWSIVDLIFLITAGLIIDATKNTNNAELGYSLGVAMVVGSAIVGIFAIVRRLQDVGHSGWWGLMSLIPFVGLILWIALFFLPSNKQQL